MSRERIDKVIVQFREQAIGLIISIKRVTQQALVRAIHGHRELLVRAVHAVSSSHNPVLISVRGERRRRNQAVPRIAEVSGALVVFVECKIVFNSIRGYAEFYALLLVSNIEGLAVRKANRRCSASIDRHIITERVSQRNGCELHAEFHASKSRNFKAVRAHFVPSGIRAEHAIDLEATLSSRHTGCDGERRRSATSTLRRPDSVQRTDIFSIGFESVNLAECFSIEFANRIRAIGIQCPASQASISAAHDIERLERLGFSNTCKRVSLARDHIRTEEHVLRIRIRNILVVVERVRVLQERSLDGTDIHIRSEHATRRVIGPYIRSTRTLDGNLCIRIENDIRSSHFKRHIIERDISIA